MGQPTRETVSVLACFVVVFLEAYLDHLEILVKIRGVLS
jgi:hypothetical protein